MSNFSSMSFNPDNNTLTITNNGTTVHTFDLGTTAVKLKVTRPSGQLKVEAETGSLSNFGTSRLEWRLKYDASTTLPSIRFGESSEDVCVNIGGNQTIVDKNKVQLFIIGSDDIRNNRSGGQVLRMEGDIVSLGIDSQENMLVVRQHDTINPNV